MKRKVNIILTILLVLLPCLATENIYFFQATLILWPILIITLLVFKVKDFNKIDLSKGIYNNFENKKKTGKVDDNEGIKKD